ncbi:MAG TPA: hypothetical protein VN658_07510 [Candidatus Acidoferrales bacterium]|nr:hypothetical protein [Candidatus Acidoferrales bacterium]
MAPDFDAPMELVEDGEGWVLVAAEPSVTKKKDKARKSSRQNKRP